MKSEDVFIFFIAIFIKPNQLQIYRIMAYYHFHLSFYHKEVFFLVFLKVFFIVN